MNNTKFRVRDPWTKNYIFNWITIDEALRTKTAFLPQDVVYEMMSELTDRKWNYIYHWDIVQNWEWHRKLVLYWWMSRRDDVYMDDGTYLWFWFVWWNTMHDDLMQDSLQNNDWDIIWHHHLHLQLLSE